LYFFLQLWHVGRISQPALQIDNATPVAPSAIKPEGQTFTAAGFVPLVTPRAFELSEIAGIVAQYRQATPYALDAGFDGVEIHAANGYLLDQFLRDSINQRNHIYNGTLEHRTRLLVEVITAIVSFWAAERVGIRLSPLSPANEIAGSVPETLFSDVVQQLNTFGLLYLHLLEAVTGGLSQVEGGFDLQRLRKRFNGLYIANNGYDRGLAISARQQGLADLIAFGRPFIANPDLVARLKLDAPLNSLDNDTLYGGGAKGYIDYPLLDQ